MKNLLHFFERRSRPFIYPFSSYVRWQCRLPTVLQEAKRMLYHGLFFLRLFTFGDSTMVGENSIEVIKEDFIHL